MKTKTKAFRGRETKPSGESNVLRFPISEAAEQARNIAARQRIAREALTALTCANDDAAPVAFAMATILRDGTIEISATGIERDFAMPIADALDRMSTILRFHAAAPKRKDRLQRGFAALIPLVSIAFMAATYVNQFAWLDSALMLAGQISMNWLSRRTPHPR